MKGREAPIYRPDQLLDARHDTPDQTGAVIDFEPLDSFSERTDLARQKRQEAKMNDDGLPFRQEADRVIEIVYSTMSSAIRTERVAHFLQGMVRANLEAREGNPEIENPDPDRLLARIRVNIGEWEQHIPGSRREREAAEAFTRTFAELDAYLKDGGRWPQDWCKNSAPSK